MVTDMNKLDELCGRVIRKETPKFDFDKWKQKHADSISVFQTQIKSDKAAYQPSIWRNIMKHKLTKIAAVFLLSTAGILLLSIFNGENGTAFAQVIEYFNQYPYRYYISIQEEDTDGADIYITVLEPGLVRMETPDEQESIIGNLNTDECLMLFHSTKTAQFGNDNLEGMERLIFNIMLNPVDIIADLKQGQEKLLGTQNIDGIVCNGFSVQLTEDSQQIDVEIWADAQSGFPIKVNMEIINASGEDAKCFLTDFQTQIDVNLTDFRLEPPAGYQIKLPSGR